MSNKETSAQKKIKNKLKNPSYSPKQFDNVLLHMWGQKTEAKRFSYSNLRSTSAYQSLF